MSNRNLVVVAVFAGSLALFNVSSASAGGVIGDFVEGVCGNCGAGRALDQANEQLGQPAEQIGGAFLQANGVPLSARCVTPYGEAFGPFLPINGPCNVNGVWGIVQ